MATLLAFHTYDFSRIWFSFRTAPGAWTLSKLYYTAPSTPISGFCTSGIELIANIGNPRGVIAGPSNGGTLEFVGQGTPDTPQPIVVDNLAVGLNEFGYWDTSQGAWWIGGKFWALIPAGNTFPYTLSMIESVDGSITVPPTTWHAQDQSNAPVGTPFHLRWDGVSDFVDVFCPIAGSSHIFGFYTFNFAIKQWSAPYGVLDFGRQLYCNVGHSSSGNGIYRFPNGDIGVLYSDRPTASLYYRLYSSGTWGAEVVVKTTVAGFLAGLGQVIPDTSKESLHIFEQHADPGFNPNLNEGQYHIVDHNGTVHANLFTFPSRVQTDGFGHGVIFEGSIFTSWDNSDDTTATNDVWAAPVTGGATTFVEEFLPKPALEAGLAPSCTYLIPAEIIGPPLSPGGANRMYYYVQ